MKPGRERNAQKERTRLAILDGARTLLRQGRPVTVVDAAEVHGISKATAYRYFSDPAMLVAEAGLDISVKPFDEVVAGCGSLRQRLKAISLYFFDLVLENEAGFRQFVGMTLTAWKPDEGQRPAYRGARRLTMYRRALAEDDGGLSPDDQDRLVRALAMSTGTEALVALVDVVGATPEQARDSVCDVTDAILNAFLPAR